ncbi:hypothetical protein TUM20985_48970 [Mycobacterium antarcticum]|nr:hypothetical protein TUM20985_48970 [Mycolicibacterium sp. TUM20985]GLP77558.1 hypothetical protein TUM20983_46680 [Mycolicibacterium sp. TUM20983]
MTTITRLALGGVIGILLGLLGGGGSILAEPALVYVIHLDVNRAIPKVRASQVPWRYSAVRLPVFTVDAYVLVDTILPP